MKLLPRRQFLRGAAGVTIALPSLLSLEGRAKPAHAAQNPKRFIAMATVLGTYPERFWPRAPGSQPFAPDYRPQRNYATGTGDGESTSFELQEIGKPLEAHKGDLIYVEGLNRANSSGHGGYCNLLTGVSSPVPKEEIGGAMSLDQAIAKKIGGDTKFSSLQIGVQNSGTGKYACLSWYASGQPAPAEPNPIELYKRVFAEVPDRGADNSALEAMIARRKSVLDAAMAQAKTLQQKASAADKAKLENYFDSVRQVELRLTKINAALGCSKPASPALGPFPKNIPVEATPDVAQAQVELLTLAFACDLTRVATFQIGHEGSNMTHPWLQVPIRHHDLSHTKPDAADYQKNYDHIAAIGNWHAKVLAVLIDRLKQMPEGESTVWDNTLVLWMNGLTWGCFHSDDQIPVMLAGSAGGHFKTGRHLRFSREKGMPIATTNDVMAQVQKAYGITDSGFGDPAFNQRPLPQLVG